MRRSFGVRRARPGHHIRDNLSAHHGRTAATVDSGVHHHNKFVQFFYLISDALMGKFFSRDFF
jgi:hypothetical protein